MKKLTAFITLLALFVLVTPAFAGFNLTAKLGADFSHTFYLGSGARHDISSFALYDATNTTVTSKSHGLSNGDRIIIVNSDYYTGTYTVANKTDNTFTIAKTFEKTETKADWMDAYNLTGYTAEAKIYDAPAGTTELEDMDATVSDATGGEISVELTDTEVDAMGIETDLWDLIIIDGSGNREVMVSGFFYVKGYGYSLGTTTGTVVSVSDPATTVAVVGGRGPAFTRATTIATSAYTVGTNDSNECYGGTVFVESAAVVTACTPSVGIDFSVITNAGDYAVDLDMPAGTAMYLDGVLLDNGDRASNNSTNGDLINCKYRSSTTLVCTSGSLGGTGVWTDGGP